MFFTVHAGRDCFLDEQVLELAVAELHHLVVLLKVWKEGGGRGSVTLRVRCAAAGTIGASPAAMAMHRQKQKQQQQQQPTASDQRPATCGQRQAASDKRQQAAGSQRQHWRSRTEGLAEAAVLVLLHRAVLARAAHDLNEGAAEGGRGGRGQSVRQSCLVGGERGAV